MQRAGSLFSPGAARPRGGEGRQLTDSMLMDQVTPVAMQLKLPMRQRRRQHPGHRPDRLRPVRGPHARPARGLSVHVSKPVEPAELVAVVASFAGVMQ